MIFSLAQIIVVILVVTVVISVAVLVSNRLNSAAEPRQEETQLTRLQIIQQASQEYENLRIANPNSPETFGTSTALQAASYPGYPFQNGNEFSTSLKIEYNTGANKFSLPALSEDLLFDIVPSATEAGIYDPEIVSAGFDNSDRLSNNVWYGVTADEENFYYVAIGFSTFGTFFGAPPATAALVIARRQSDASLVWVRNCENYQLEIPGTTYFPNGSRTVIRVAPAIFEDRLYVTSALTNLGPQLFCIDKSDGTPVWTMAYYLPPSHPDYPGVLQAPADVPFNSQDGSAYFSERNALGDMHLIVKELNGNPAVFVGVASYQNAFEKVFSPNVWPEENLNDQGQLLRINDLGVSGAVQWRYETCPRDIEVGDTISIGNPDPMLDPFLPGNTTFLAWRTTTATGLMNEGGITAQALDNTGPHPGFIPANYTAPGGPNNNRIPIAYTFRFSAADVPVTEADLPNAFRSTGVGIGGTARVYERVVNQGFSTTPLTITDILANKINILGGSTSDNTRATIWAYITPAEAAAMDTAAWGATNAGVRYAAAYPDGYTITNANEASYMNYRGCSFWSSAPVVDVSRNMLYVGTAQPHSLPLEDQLLIYDPEVDYYEQVKELVDLEYQYTQNDTTLNGSGPFATLEDVNAKKLEIEEQEKTLVTDPTRYSRRSSFLYNNSIVGIDLTTGDLKFGLRTVSSDLASFVVDPQINLPRPVGIDADVSAGVQFFDNVTFDNGDQGWGLCACTKGGMIVRLNMTDFDPNVAFDNLDFAASGIKTDFYYAGPLSALGGSNYASGQDGGHLMIFNNHNSAATVNGSGVQSDVYTDNFFEGLEFHVTRDGRVFDVKQSLMMAYDIRTNTFKWENSLYGISFSVPSIYNGVVFAFNSQGLGTAFDIETGTVLWHFDGNQYGMGGIDAPVFLNGVGYLISSYQNPSAGVGTFGNTGAMLRVKEEKVIIPIDTTEFLANGTFVSYDVDPKEFGPNIFNSTFSPEEIEHTWSGNNLTASHLQVTSTLIDSYNTQIQTYNNQTKTMTLASDSNNTSLIYGSLIFLNTDSYVLNYQRLVNGEYESRRATFRKVVV